MPSHMAKKKKSRKQQPALSRLSPSSHMDDDPNPNPRMSETLEDDHGTTQIPNSISIDQETKSHNQSPKSIEENKKDLKEIDGDDQNSQNPKEVEEDEEEDVVEIQEKPQQVENHEKDANFDDMYPNVLQRGRKRKKPRGEGVEKKLKKKDENPLFIDEDKVDLEEIGGSNLMEDGNDSLAAAIGGEEKEELEVEEIEEQKPPQVEKQQKLQGEDATLLIEGDEPEGMQLSPPLAMPPMDEGLVLDLVLDSNQPPCSAPNTLRKGPKRKKLTSKQRAMVERKLVLVKKNLQPLPFVPEKNLDFSKHEELFKRLGLWDFVNMEFDQDIRSDLLALLIANYIPANRGSTVNDVKIKLSRADLARALKLPVKKDKSVSLETSDFDVEELTEESITFLVEFMENWVLLHEDMWILPKEILSWEALVKKGQPHKVDWAGLIWYMVDKELKQAEYEGTLYFASHIQCLMKSQRDDLFKEEPKLEVPMDEEEDTVDLTMGSLEDYQGQELEQQQTELCLGQDEQQFREEDVMDYEYKQQAGVPPHWLLDGKNQVSDHCLRRCNLNEAQNLENLENQDMVKEHDDEEEYDPQSKCNTLGGLASTDLLQTIGTTNITYSPSLRLRGQSSGDFFQSGVDTDLNPGGMSMFANAYSRELGEDDIADHDTLNGHHNTLNGHHNRMTNDASSDFHICIEQMSSWMNKAKMAYEEKEQACLNTGMNEVVSDLQHQNNILANNLQKTRYENYKLENELVVMRRLLEGYRKALKENRRAFSEYRERKPQPEEPLYKDAGPGGIVLSIMELEKQRSEREEEDKLQRLMFEQMFEDSTLGWFQRLKKCENDVHRLDERLLEFEDKVKHLKEIFAKPKTAET